MAQALRRALIALGNVAWNLSLNGVLSTFAAFWRRVHLPINEVYYAPLTGSLTCDVGVKKATPANLLSKIRAAVSTASILVEEGEVRPTNEEVVADLAAFFRQKGISTSPQNLKRFSFS